LYIIKYHTKILIIVNPYKVINEFITNINSIVNILKIFNK